MAIFDIQDIQRQPAVSDLRSRVVRGGFAIALRQGFGLILSAVNLILVTRIIGPFQYGLFAASYGIVSTVATAGTWGIDVYLLRKPQEPDPAEYDQAFTFLFLTGASFLLALIAFRHSIARLSGVRDLAFPLAVMSIYIPLNLINVPGTVRLDRGLRFHRIGLIELIGQASGYAVAIPLAFCNMGCWAPILGALTGQSILLVMIYSSAPMRLRFRLDFALSKQMLSYGLSYSGAIWIWQLRTLVNPLIVGRFAGAQGVGFVALAIRLAEALSFIKQATWRVAMAALAKLDGNVNKLRNSITEGMCLQAFMVGIPLTLFAAVAPFILPHIFGSRWSPAFYLFPFIALSYLMNALFNLHTSVLALVQRNLQIAHFHIAHVILFAGSAIILVPRLGYIGYGWAEVAAFASYYILHRYLEASIGTPDYGRALLWLIVCSACILATYLPDKLGILALSLLPLPLLFRRERVSLGGYARLLMRKSNA